MGFELYFALTGIGVGVVYIDGLVFPHVRWGMGGGGVGGSLHGGVDGCGNGTQ